MRHRFIIFIEFIKTRTFLAHLVYQKGLKQSCFVCRPPVSSALASYVNTHPRHRVRNRKFIFGMNMPICPWYFSLIFYPAHTDSCRDFIVHIPMYLFFTYIHKRNNATVTYFLKFMSIFLKFIYSLLLI